MAFLSLQVYIGYLLYFCNTVLYCGTCKFLISFANDFRQSLSAIEEGITSTTTIKKPLLARTYRQIDKKFREAIEFNCEFKQLRWALRKEIAKNYATYQ